MSHPFRDTVFGRVSSLVSGGRLFRWEERKTPSRLDAYRLVKGNDIASSPTPSEKFDDRGVLDSEQGHDKQLVDWIENDPEVRDDP